jgi:hypothetical protein
VLTLFVNFFVTFLGLDRCAPGKCGAHNVDSGAAPTNATWSVGKNANWLDWHERAGELFGQTPTYAAIRDDNTFGLPMVE